jgi:ribosomal protein L7/L12
MNKERLITLVVAFVVLYSLAGGLCTVLVPATMTPFLEMTCPEGTVASAVSVRRSTGNGVSFSSRASCEGEGGTALSRSAGATTGQGLYQATVALGFMVVGGLWLRLKSRETVTPPEPSPGIHLEGDMTLRQLITEQRKLDAIKYVREMSGAGLREAKDYVEWLTHQMGDGADEADETGGNVGLAAAAHDAEMLDFLTQGRKIEAIKRVRVLTGVGLKEAKDFVEMVERGEIDISQPAPLPPLPSTPSPTFQVSPEQAAYDPEVREYLAQGQKINAIKRVRELTGLGLKEAKDWVEKWE